MTNEALMSLQHSESVVAQMAATIFAGLVQKSELASVNEDILIGKAVTIAIKMAQQTDKFIKSDGEWLKKEPS
jgi:hypothetical protein